MIPGWLPIPRRAQPCQGPKARPRSEAEGLTRQARRGQSGQLGIGSATRVKAAGPSDGRSAADPTRAGTTRNLRLVRLTFSRRVRGWRCAPCFPGVVLAPLPCLIGLIARDELLASLLSASAAARDCVPATESINSVRPVPMKRSDGCRGSVSPGVRPFRGSRRFRCPPAKMRLREPGRGIRVNPPIPWG